jgi:hypothetical protein
MHTYSASYDLKSTHPDPHKEYIKQAKVLGWNDWVQDGDKVWNKLPNTTIIGTFPNVSTAIAKFNQIATETQKQGFVVVVEKVLLVEFKTGNVESDEKKT